MTQQPDQTSQQPDQTIQQQPQQSRRELVLTFHNENFDELTSERINTFINNSRGHVVVQRR